MSDTPVAAPVAESPPPVAAPAPVPIAAPVAAPKPSDAEPAVGEPGWMKARVDRAKESGKKEARKELKAERRAVRTAGEEAAQVKAAAAAEVAAAKSAVDAILANVPEAQRAAITKASGGTAAGLLQAFSVWQAAQGAVPIVATPAATPQAAADATQAPPPAAIAAPASTSTNVAAPTPPAPGTPEDRRATYEDLKESNPYLAKQYLAWYSQEIYPETRGASIKALNKK